LTTSLVEHEPVGPAGPRIEPAADTPAGHSIPGHSIAGHSIAGNASPGSTSPGSAISGSAISGNPVTSGSVVSGPALDSHIEGRGNGNGTWDAVNNVTVNSNVTVNGASLDRTDRSDLQDHELELLADDAEGLDDRRRTIKRYSNRKLYDTRQSRYVTLLQIAEMVRAGEDVQIIDNATKEDKTDVTLALIISEELKARPRAIPLATLKALIRHRGGKLLTQLRESPIGRLMPRDENSGIEHALTVEAPISDTPANAEEAQVSKEQHGSLRRTIEQWQHTIDERIRAVVPHYAAIQELQGEVQQLSRRLEELEKRLSSPQE
jgi:polyhydroxyalkanoate synthesis repressor PhaR